MKKLIPAALSLALVLAFSVSAHAGGRKKAAAPVHNEPLIQSVSATAVTVTEGTQTKTVPLNQFTEITVKGQRATLADLKPGMMVSVTLGTDGKTASRINGEDAPAYVEPPRKKPKSPKGFMN